MSESPTGDGTQTPASDSREYPGPLAYAGIGMLNAVCLLGGAALGWLADEATGTLPLFLFLGFLVGAGAGVLATRVELKRYRRPG